MNPLEFLRAVWPETGAYCVATKAAKGGYIHYVYDTIEEAAAQAVRLRETKDVFFAVHALTEKRVWNPKKSKDEDGEWVGGWQYRTHENMRAAKAFFFDLDVGADKPYATQSEAAQALIAFCGKSSLPKPMVVNSGRGLHVYWLLDTELLSPVWKVHAKRLFGLAKAHGLLVDPARTDDESSVLRVAGTQNLKGAPLPVKVLVQGVVTPTADFLSLLGGAVDDAELLLVGSAPSAMDDLGSNVTIEFDGPPVTIRQLGDACGQIRNFALLKGVVPYSAWHKTVAVIRHVENGSVYAHALSAGHPGYNRDELDQKLWDQERGNIGPTTCPTMRDNCDSSICDVCPYWGLVTSPMCAARTPKPTEALPDVPENLEPPCNPPAGFSRVEGGGVIFRKRTEDKVIPITILNCDLYPLQGNIDDRLETDQHDWCAKLPRGKIKVFPLDSGVIQEPVLLAKELSKHSIYVTPGDNKLVQLYMSLYIKDLQRQKDAENQFSFLGWTSEKREAFVLPDITLLPGGKTTSSRIGYKALAHLRQDRGMGQAGTLSRQTTLMRFYNRPEYLDRQFYILCSIAAPFFHATGHHGSIVHATGLPGAAKSTTLFAAMSLWGHPKKLAINGQESGNTANARNQIISIMNNLPVGMDELTNIEDDVAKEFALNVSQVQNDKGRCGRDGQIKTGAIGGDKSTLILTSGNTSMHAIMSRNNVAGDAGSMRVFEMTFERPDKAGKPHADRFLFDLCENYGHIGPAFMRHGIDHYDDVVQAVRRENARLDTLVDVNPHERFWTSIGAAALAVGEIAVKLGLLPFNIAMIREWLVKVQFPVMRGTVKDQYPSAAEILTSYIEANGDAIVFVPEGNTSILREPPRALKGRYEMDSGTLWLTKNAFADYCAARRAPFQQYLNELATLRIVTDRNVRKVLTTGTSIAPTRSWCFAINTRHAEMGDLGDKADKMAKARPNLRLVKTDTEKKQT